MVAEGLACDPKGVRAYLLLLILNFFFLIYKCSRERERGGVIPSDFFNLSNAFLPFLCEIAKKSI